MKPSSFLENHATQGVLFSASALFCLILMAEMERSSVAKWVLIVLAFTFALNVFWVGTGRSGYLFLLVISLVGAFLLWRSKLYAVVGVGCILVLGLLVSETSRSRIQQAYNESVAAFSSGSEYSSIGVRIVMWKNTLEVIKSSPFLGVGAGSFESEYSRVVSGVNGWRGLVSDDPHQQFLHICAEYGAVGLLVFLLGLFSVGSSGGVTGFSLGSVGLLCI